jgi:DNA-binding NtrC family response regulator
MVNLHGKGTVLLIDDDHAIVDVLGHFLQRRGYDTLKAYNAEEAQSLWNIRRATISAVICDKWLNASYTSSELLRGFAQDNPSLPVVIMSGDPYDDTDQKFVVRDGFNYLPKPFEPNDLFELLECAIEHLHH